MTEHERMLGAWIRSWREERNWSQERLAAEMRARGRQHWIQTTVSKAETGNRLFMVGDIVALGQITGLMFCQVMQKGGYRCVWLNEECTPKEGEPTCVKIAEQKKY